MNGSRRAYHALLHKVFILGALAVFSGISTPAFADVSQLGPQTKLRLTIVQWMPTKGEYQQWEALGGELIVSEAGTISLPVLGMIAVGNFDPPGLATEIAKRLQAKIGLVEVPETTVEILEYPPVYVVGDVASPGEYKFRPGLTALQALAMSGGEFRETNSGPRDKIELIGELQGTDLALLRSHARIARLQAEMAGAKEIQFPQPFGADSTLAAAIHNQERIIFSARANVLARQSKSFSELRNLLTQEIRVLEEKVDGAEVSIVVAEQQLKGVKTLVERGVTVSSRQSDLERELAGYRADRLDFVTAIMRARQNISETTRNLEGLIDKHQSDIATELQAEQATLEQLKLQRATKEKLLIDTLSAAEGSVQRDEEDGSVTFIITRRGGGKIIELPASQATALMPGDVVRIARRASHNTDLSPAPLGSSRLADPRSERPSQ
ncbi:polysaccharide biosynthesis/export family protein [Sinorhizobium numidicum]|uniref:Polysaccharide biosynthesis/export family protein n=1 Tax=Sinorhizobium numidicum TaxID=680248 RepID=A0ABY8CQP5_9HYPH|nr:polysaccharide biosynthesis/export family protein [Sinorhizobium numidicum]WEX74990.1 polysaccharide biosynthesis/export family protein [Sinorhizobium numidicum]WEX80984.1 polysaccharide biosynthesis/export family protein [Sinorhizobium numidicum]